MAPGTAWEFDIDTGLAIAVPEPSSAAILLIGCCCSVPGRVAPLKERLPCCYRIDLGIGSWHYLNRPYAIRDSRRPATSNQS